MKPDSRTDRVMQIGNLREDKGFHNPQGGRVYSTDGLAPCLDNSGGGQREIKILTRG